MALKCDDMFQFSLNDDVDYVLELAEAKAAVEKLKQALLDTHTQLKKEIKSKKQLEAKLRTEICEEMMQQITEIENHYEWVNVLLNNMYFVLLSCLMFNTVIIIRDNIPLNI